MEQLISRQAAIDALHTWFRDGFDADKWWNSTHVLAAIEGIPPAEPKTGKWIYGEDSMADCVDGYRCDQCGFFVPWDYQHKSIDYIKDYNFCPNCGADMRGEQNGRDS